MKKYPLLIRVSNECLSLMCLAEQLKLIGKLIKHE